MKNYFKQRLKRNKQNKMIAGVCSGISNYFDIDPVLVRVLFVVGSLSAYPFILAYLILWIVTPYEEIEIKNNKSDKYSDE